MRKRIPNSNLKKEVERAGKGLKDVNYKIPLFLIYLP